MTEETRRPAGAMTRAMSARSAQNAGPRVLRLGVLQHETMIEERVVRERAAVTVGTTERATVTVHAEGFPAHAELFTVRDGRWHLRVEPQAEGRVASGGAVRSLDEWRRDAGSVQMNDAVLVPLDDASRGKVTLAGVTFLFQFVPPPPEAPRPQVPMALRRSLAREMDWRYNASLACFLSVAIGGLAWVEYGYDPIVDDNADLMELVSRRVHLDIFNDTPIEPDPPPAPATAEASATPASGPPAPGPRPHAPRGPDAPRAPNPTDVARAAQRAEDAAARAARAVEASFGAITSVAAGPNSAVDQLNNQVLMAGTADDLHNVGAITTRSPSAVGRPTALAANNLPGGQRLGEHRAVATGEGPGTSDRVVEREICRDCFTPAPAPETDTCGADASAVARALRTNLGGIRACYERIARTNHTLRGRLVVRFTVGETGRATSVNVQGVDEALDQCVERAVSRMVFPPPTCGAADFEYPVTVSPSE